MSLAYIKGTNRIMDLFNSTLFTLTLSSVILCAQHEVFLNIRETIYGPHGDQTLILLSYGSIKLARCKWSKSIPRCSAVKWFHTLKATIFLQIRIFCKNFLSKPRNSLLMPSFIYMPRCVSMHAYVHIHAYSVYMLPMSSLSFFLIHIKI